MNRCLVAALCFLCSLACAETAVKGEWIVMRRDSSSWARVTKELGSGFSFLRSFGPGSRFALLKRKSSGKKIPLARSVLHLQRNYIYRALDLPDPDFAKSWALQNTGTNQGIENGNPGADIDALRAWEIQGSSASVPIAVLDSGLDLAHEDLQKVTWKKVKPWNFITETEDVQDDSGHGSFIAGILSAESKNGKGTRGVGNSPLLILKILDANGRGTTERAVRAIEYAVNHGAKLINASWGSVVFDPALHDTIKWAGEKGVLLIAASGNDGRNNDIEPNPCYPASYSLPTILSVAAYDNRDKLASFSNYGKRTVHLGAPGEGIYSTTKGGAYRFGEGTSFATPFVTGVAALVKERVPELSPVELKERLLRTSVPLGYYEREKTETGGRVNAYYALIDFVSPKILSPTTWYSHQTLLATPHPYPNGNHDTLEIVHKGATHLRVHFSRFELEQKYDTVVLKDKFNRVVAMYTDDLGEFTSADALGDTLRIELHSDYAISKWGFEVDRYEVSYD